MVNELSVESEFEKIIRMAKHYNDFPHLVNKDKKPRIEFFHLSDSMLSKELRDKFDCLQKTLDDCDKPIDDSRIYLKEVHQLFSGIYDIKYTGHCIFLHDLDAHVHDHSTMIAAVLPY